MMQRRQAAVRWTPGGLLAPLALAGCVQPLKLARDDSPTVLSHQLLTAPNPAEPGRLRAQPPPRRPPPGPPPSAAPRAEPGRPGPAPGPDALLRERPRQAAPGIPRLGHPQDPPGGRQQARLGADAGLDQGAQEILG